MAAANDSLGAEELLAHAREFVFHLAPHETDETDAVAVCWRGPGAWVVTDRQGSVLNRNGRWEWEPQPSSRTPAFLRRTRFTRDEAIHRAMTAIDADRRQLTTNGFAVDAWGIVAYNAARRCACTRDPKAISAWRARLNERDRAALDRYLTARGVAMPRGST
jgi:hypothetical protein